VEILLLENLIPEAKAWLESQHTVHYHPEWVDNPDALRKGAYKVNAMVLPRQVVVNRAFLDFAPKLQVIARLHVGSDNTDLEACRERDVRVVQPTHANIRSNAEYLLASLLLLYRRGVVSALAGARRSTGEIGRELSGSTVGLLGLAPTAHTLASMLSGLGVRLIGYDPAIHHSSDMWKRLQIEPVTLPELAARADAVSVQMLYASRFDGFIGSKLLAACKKGQLWVGTSRSRLFNAQALADALSDGRIEACWTALRRVLPARVRPCAACPTCTSRRAWARLRMRRACARAGMWRIARTKPWRRRGSQALAACPAGPWIWTCQVTCR
jgi:phosphoglycerate dehydrogenase-like enzyme